MLHHAYNRNARASDAIDFQKIVALLHLPDFDDSYNEKYGWEAGDAAEKQALDDGASQEEAEGARFKAEEETQREVFAQYFDAVMRVASELFGEHGLELEEAGSGKWRTGRWARPWQFRIVPKTSWRDAAHEIMKTINGVGDFGFDTLQDFMRSGPYTARQAVLAHLGYIEDWPRVYEGRTAQGMFERAWRR